VGEKAWRGNHIEWLDQFRCGGGEKENGSFLLLWLLL
jgi:hypothetical protein